MGLQTAQPQESAILSKYEKHIQSSPCLKDPSAAIKAEILGWPYQIQAAEQCSAMLLPLAEHLVI